MRHSALLINLVPCPVLIREDSSSIRWEQVQRPTARHYSERETKLKISIRCFPFDLREHYAPGGGETIGVRVDGEHQDNISH